MALRRIILQLPPREQSLLQHAQFLLRATSELHALDPRLAGFRVDLGDKRGDPVWSAEALASELDKRKKTHDDNGDLWVRYRVMIAVPEGRRIRAHMSLSCGHNEQGGKATPVASTVKFAWLGRHAPSATDFRRMLTTLVGLYNPLWATLGGSYAPSPHVGAGRLPLVGWDTYLSRHYGPLPKFGDKVVVTKWGELGSIVRAFPEVLDENNREHLGELVAIERALREAGNLKPTEELAELPHEPALPAADDGSEQHPQPAASQPEVDATNAAFAAFVPLPFKEAGTEALPPPTAVPAEASPDQGGTIDIHMLQPAQVAATSDRLMDASQITVYARLHAELAAGVEGRPAVYARHGIQDDAHLIRVDAWWKALFTAEPVRHAQWGALYQKYLREIGKTR